MFYDIYGNRIHIVECMRCHRQVGVSVEDMNKYVCSPNILKEIGEKEMCCERPDFKWLCSSYSVPNNFSNP